MAGLESRTSPDRGDLDGRFLHDSATRAEGYLAENETLINALNVFPIPDGETGTNMVLTLRSAVQRLKDRGNGSLNELSHELWRGALLGARGNSGVILAQFLYGFACSINTKPAVTFQEFTEALRKGADDE